MESGSILSFDMGLLINIAIQWFNVLLITVVLVRVLYDPVRNFMKKRAKRIENSMLEARKRGEDAQALRAEYEVKLADIEKEREELLRQTHLRALEEQEQAEDGEKDPEGELFVVLERRAEDDELEDKENDDQRGHTEHHPLQLLENKVHEFHSCLRS